MLGMSSFEFIGYLTKEPEVHDNKALIRIAVNREYRDIEGDKRRQVDYFTIFFYNRDAVNVGALLHTGDMVYVRGRVEHNNYSYKFRAERFLLLRRVTDV